MEKRDILLLKTGYIVQKANVRNLYFQDKRLVTALEDIHQQQDQL